MRYMVLIQGDEAYESRMTKEELGKLMAEFGAHRKAMVEAGVFKSGEPLMPSRTATTIRIRDGKRITTDGPFAETKEQLGGYYVLECDNIDEALTYAAKIPAAEHGSVEVRPVWAM